jgi:hypothetical protein
MFSAGLAANIQPANIRCPFSRLSFTAILAIMGILPFQTVAMRERVLFPWSSGAQNAATPAA